MTPRPRPLLALAVLVLTPLAPARADEKPFFLKDGDRVVFYGDSITDQRLYTTFAETYVVTRFPKLDVTFVHSGWGGDRVTGGGGGPIDRRLERDVFAYRPTVVTVMLGMNDASYRAFDEKIFNTYKKGYEHLVASIKEHVPGVRMTLIQPSPFDDVTRKPNFEGGYNEVLRRYGAFVKGLAEQNGLNVADLNTSVVEATKKAAEIDPERAKQLNPDRVHPGPGGQLLMAAALLDAWHAPALVSDVAIRLEGETGVRAEVKNSRVDVPGPPKDGVVTWTQTDGALPFPIDTNDPVVALAVKASDVVKQLNQQNLKVEGLKPGRYTLKIDGDEAGEFGQDELASGVNLATLAKTPMARQARAVHALTLKHNNIHFLRWRQVQVPFQSEDKDQLRKALDGLDALEAAVVAEQRREAQPKPHTFELSPVK